VVCNDELIVLMGEQAKEKKPMTKFHWLGYAQF
jgi:hypothetical protein